MSIMSKVKRFVSKNAKVLGITMAVIAAAGLGSATIGKSFAASPANSDRDCTDNSVMYCGAESLSELQNKYDNGDGDPYGNAQKTYMIHDIYNWFGISPSDISSMNSSNTITGYVSSNGDVYTGDPNGDHTLVATDALTGGRTGTPSEYQKYGATGFYVRTPSVSFIGATPTNIINLKAFVVVKNGVFQYAIMYSCGNAVKAVPVPPKPKPALTCAELTGVLASTDTSDGDQTYNFTAKATPTNGATITSYHFNFGDGSSAIVNSASSTATTSHKYVPGTWTATVTIDGSDSLQTSCTRTVTVPKQALVCAELEGSLASTDTSDGDQTYNFTAKATPTNNAPISSYNFTFDDGASKTVATTAASTSTTHVYAPGTYTAKVTVSGKVDGSALTTPVTVNCEKTITVKKPSTPTPTPGSLVCDELTLSAGTPDASGNVTYTLTGSATPSASNATISSYNFEFGGNFGSRQVPSLTNQASTTFTYPAGTNVTASVSVNGTVNGKPYTASSTNCAKAVKVPSLPQASSIICESLDYGAGTANSEGDIPYTFTVNAVPSNATINSYTYTFAQGTTSTLNTNSATYTYAPGTAVTASVLVNGTLANGSKVQVSSANCAVKFTVPTTPTCTSATGQTYPAGSSQCQTCTAPSGQVYPAGSSQCTPTPTPTPTPTTTLPNTGPGDVVGLFSGVSMSGAGIHRILGNRRARRAAARR